MDKKEYYTTFYDNKLIIGKNNSFFNLLFDLYGDTVHLYKRVFDNIETIIELTIDTLNNDEKDLIIKKYGMSNMIEMSIEEIAESTGSSADIVNDIEFRAYKKLKSPYRKGLVIYGEKVETYDGIYITDDFYLHLKNEVKEEIKAIVDEKVGKNIFLDNIFDRNHISIAIQKSDAYNKDVGEMNLSPRSYNYLKRNEINTIADALLLSDADFRNVHNLGSHSIAEIQGSLDKYKLGIEGFKTIIYIENNNKTIYKYSVSDVEKVASSLMQLILDEKRGKNLFDKVFSPFLTNYLLMKGYLYIDDVLADSNTIIEQLTRSDFNDLSKEMELYSNYTVLNSSDDEMITIYNLNSEAMSTVKDKKITSEETLKSIMEEINDVVDELDELDPEMRENHTV